MSRIIQCPWTTPEGLDEIVKYKMDVETSLSLAKCASSLKREIGQKKYVNRLLKKVKSVNGAHE